MCVIRTAIFIAAIIKFKSLYWEECLAKKLIIIFIAGGKVASDTCGSDETIEETNNAKSSGVMEEHLEHPVSVDQQEMHQDNVSFLVLYIYSYCYLHNYFLPVKYCGYFSFVVTKGL